MRHDRESAWREGVVMVVWCGSSSVVFGIDRVVIASSSRDREQDSGLSWRWECQLRGETHIERAARHPHVFK